MVYLAEGVAADAAGYRPGARHAMLILVRGDASASLDGAAEGIAQASGWRYITLKKAAELDCDLASIEKGSLRSAVDYALEQGQALVVYRDEIPPDA